MTDLPMFERATRRALLKRGLAAGGLLTSGAWLAACGGGNDDRSVFSSTTLAPAAPTAAPASSTAAAPRSSPPPTTPARSAPNGTTTNPTSTSASAVAAAAAVAVAFSYTATDPSGRVRNPYIAVWVEDASSAMVGLISVWYSAREARYLRELTEFAAVAGNVTSTQADAVSGATRAPGAYNLQWDGKALDGQPLAGGHTVWIEAAREHGPHSVMSGPIVLGQAGTTAIKGMDELSDATVTIK